MIHTKTKIADKCEVRVKKLNDFMPNDIKTAVGWNDGERYQFFSDEQMFMILKWRYSMLSDNDILSMINPIYNHSTIGQQSGQLSA